MKDRFLMCLALGAVLLVLAVPTAEAGTALYDWGLNINGEIFWSPAAYAGPTAGQLPAYINASSFDWTTGLGSITLDYRPGPGSYLFISFFDHEIDNEFNGPFNEYATDPDSAKLVSGQSWEVDEPGWETDPAYPMGDIYDHVLDNLLDNSNGLPFTNPYNVSMALGWDFELIAGKRAIITLHTTTAGPPAGDFYLEHHDLESPDIIYFSGKVDVTDIPSTGVPEPGSFILLTSGLAGLALAARRRRSGARTRSIFRISLLIGVISFLLIGQQIGSAATPVVKTPQFVPDQPTSRHPIWCDAPMTLKGTSDQGGTYVWDPADGSGALYTGTIGDRYAIQAVHSYTTANGCSTGRIYAAKLTVTNAGGESAQKIYYMEAFDKTLNVEVNRAIDDGLWALHKAMTRWEAAVPLGDWHNWSSRRGMHAVSVEAFLAMGNKETGTDENPYTETVRRGMNQFFNLLTVQGIGPQTLGNPDGNGNGIGLTVDVYRGYQTGMMLSALVASDNPTAIAQAGPASVIGRQYLDIAQDIVDWIAWAQYDDVRYGGWRYNQNELPDNSACQWDAIALISAERQWGLTAPGWVKTANNNWLTYSHHPSGWFGYTTTTYEWGGLADTASGMVQMVMNGHGRGDSRWDTAEAWLRSKWDAGTSYAPMRYNFLYAAFSFSKSMLLHTPAITTDFGGDLDWYGDNTRGLARALVNAQYAPPDGKWWSKYSQPNGEHYPFATAWAIMMLNRTVIQTGRPIAIAKAIPLQALAGQTITLDGSGSYHQAVGRSIVQWDWTIYNGSDVGSGARETKTGRFQTVSYPVMGNYLVKLTVTDDAPSPATAEDFVTVLATIPPIAPVANAGGPYRFCNQATPWILDGSRSSNADNGQHEPGAPGDYIKAYDWDLTASGTFNDAHGVKPDVTTFFSTWAPGSYLIQLRVTDNSYESFPSAIPRQDLTGTASATVVLEGNCGCVNDLKATTMRGRVDLSWRHIGATQYHIYRKTDTTGWSQIASVNAPIGVYTDTAVINLTKYYYMIKPYIATYTPSEYCESNIVSATPPAVRR